MIVLGGNLSGIVRIDTEALAGDRTTALSVKKTLYNSIQSSQMRPPRTKQKSKYENIVISQSGTGIHFK